MQHTYQVEKNAAFSTLSRFTSSTNMPGKYWYTGYNAMTGDLLTSWWDHGFFMAQRADFVGISWRLAEGTSLSLPHYCFGFFWFISQGNHSQCMIFWQSQTMLFFTKSPKPRSRQVPTYDHPSLNLALFLSISAINSQKPCYRGDAKMLISKL